MERNRGLYSRGLARAFGFATALIWGLSFLSIKVAIVAIPPMTLGLLRFVIAAALLPLLALATRESLRVRSRDLPRLASGGLIGVTLYFLCENNGVKLLSASEASLIVGVIPVVTMNVFLVNTNLVPADKMPKGWTDLADARFAKMISTARADKSGSSYMQLCNVISIYKDKGWDIYKSILANAQISGSSGSVPKFVSDGEAMVGITLEDNAYRYVIAGGPVKIVYPADGTVAAPDGIALLKGGPNPEAGKVFIDWCLSKPVQEILVKQMCRRSVRTDCSAPAGLPATSAIKTIPYDFGWAAKNQPEFVKKFQDIAMDLGL